MDKATKVSSKIKHEKRILCEMIALYCRKHHGTSKLCEQCQALANYAIERTERCPYMVEKSFCSECKTHCYKPQMREKIRCVMRYAGPRMIFYHPLAALRHLYYSKIKR